MLGACASVSSPQEWRYISMNTMGPLLLTPPCISLNEVNYTGLVTVCDSQCLCVSQKFLALFGYVSMNGQRCQSLRG